MLVYVNRRTLARMHGQWPQNFTAPQHDVRIGRYLGWDPHRFTAGEARPPHEPVLTLASMKEVADRLGLSRKRLIDLRDEPGSAFPPPAACILPAEPGKTDTSAAARKGWNGVVCGWDLDAVLVWAARTGRMEPRLQTGRPRGSGNYTELPRCGRPRDRSKHGKGAACKAVRRKIADQWAPACAIHLTDEERRDLGIT